MKGANAGGFAALACCSREDRDDPEEATQDITRLTRNHAQPPDFFRRAVNEHRGFQYYCIVSSSFFATHNEIESDFIFEQLSLAELLGPEGTSSLGLASLTPISTRRNTPRSRGFQLHEPQTQ